MASKAIKRIFVSSPSDVAAQRAITRTVFESLAREFAVDLTLRLVLWEDQPLSADRDFQQQIDPPPSECDLVVAILWSRLGTLLPERYADTGRPPPTGTEYEIDDALRGCRQNGKPDVLIYVIDDPVVVALNDKDRASKISQFEALQAYCDKLFKDDRGAHVGAHHTIRGTAKDFETTLRTHARSWLAKQLDNTEDRPRWPASKSPFRGLEPFDESYHEVFFGRSQAIHTLIERLNDVERAASTGRPQSRLLLVVGMSGNGKTSLIRAGLIPQLQYWPVGGITSWTTLTLRPSDRCVSASDDGPLGALAERLLDTFGAHSLSGRSLTELTAELATNPDVTAARIEMAVRALKEKPATFPGSARLLIYVDQLEELFTLPSGGTSADVVLSALAALATNPAIWVVATMRSDFVHRLEGHAAIQALLTVAPAITLLAPRGSELADMIREPAIAAGLKFEKRADVTLDTEILHEASQNPESLPLVQYALEQLYEQRKGNLLLWDVYRPNDREGGLRGSLIARAESLLTADGDDLAFRKVMRELTSVSDDGTATRRYAPLEAFPHGSPEGDLIQRLIRARLCVSDKRGPRAIVFLAHEALLQSWPRVQRWLLQESALLRLRDEVQADARAWVTHGRKDDWLGTAPDKLLGIDQLERASVVLTGEDAEYATRSRARYARNRLLRKAVIASICGLSVLSGAAGWIAMEQRDRSRQEAAIADRTSRFMVSLFELADPGENRGRSITVREVLDKGAQEINGVSAPDPQVRAELLTAMGQAYKGLGLYPPALVLLRNARSSVENQGIPSDSVVRTLVAYGSTLALSGDAQDANAERELRRALDIAVTRLPANSVLISDARNALADVLVREQKYEEAERLCRESLVVDRTRSVEDVAVLARTLNMLGLALYEDRKLKEVEAPWTEALQLRERHLGQRHAATAESMGNLGAWYYETGQYGKARELWERALPVYRVVYGTEHPELASILVDLGRATLMEGRVSESVPMFEQAVAMDEKFKDSSDPDLVTPLNSLTMAHLYLGEVAKATRESDRALRIARAGNDELLDQVALNAADVALANHQLDAAQSLLKEARSYLESRHPLAREPDSAWRYAVWDTVYAEQLTLTGGNVQARAVLARARSVLVSRFGPAGYYVKRVDNCLGRISS